MRITLASLLLSFAGCSKEPPPVADRSVWWLPVVSGIDADLEGPAVRLLAEKGIYPMLFGDRGWRIFIPYERSREAIALQRASPIAEDLRIHSILAGPRQGSNLPVRDPGSEEALWPAIATFGHAGLPAARVQGALNSQGIECGVIAFAWRPEEAVLFVPPPYAASARSVLAKASLGDGLRIKG